jgi:aspartate aminotransferase-like enzyme
MNLRIPGPTPLPPEVIAALQRPMIDHRSEEFSSMTLRIAAEIKAMCKTGGDVLLLTSSGTGGLESALVNTLSPGDRALACVAGTFGQKFADMAKTFGANVETITFAPGERIEPARLQDALKKSPDMRAVLITHNETSTGVLHPLREIARVVREQSDAVLIVDAVSSLAAVDVAMDDWGIDVIITGSQKALMAPPGVAIIAVNERAWKANAAAKLPRYYFDWGMHKQRMATGHTPATPAMPIFFALDAALECIQREGLVNVYARHERVAALTRTRARALGFEVLPNERDASPTVTALKVPASVDADAIRRAARKMGVVFGGGLGNMQGKIIRVGHLGYVHEADIEEAMEVLGEATAEAAPQLLRTAAAGA